MNYYFKNSPDRQKRKRLIILRVVEDLGNQAIFTLLMAVCIFQGKPLAVSIKIITYICSTLTYF